MIPSLPNLGFGRTKESTLLLLALLAAAGPFNSFGGVYGAPTAESTDAQPGLAIPLRMRSPADGLSSTELGRRAESQRDAVMAKYFGGGAATNRRKRSTGYNLIVNEDHDSLYYGSLAIGTPLTSFDVILDTGSSDLLVADSSCGSFCKGLTTFDPSSSTTFKNLTTSFLITYGSGEAAGYVAQDTVEMAGFSVLNQGFALVDVVSSGLLLSPVSGIMGLAWQTMSSSGEMPFWQTLMSSGVMDAPLFAIQLRRYTNATNPSTLEPGGEITFGYTNSSLYTGSIDYIDIPGTPSYWYLNIASLTVQGTAISIGSDSMAAIDTGTTNIAGPASAIQAIYAQIPGSSAGTGQYSGYYQYPCSTSVTVEISFGSNTWTMSSADFKYAQISSSECIGSFFEITSTSGGGGLTTPSWVIGDAFLKNVYSVFRYSPASVGFAALSEVAIAENGVNGVAPSSTIGSTTAQVTNTSGAASRVVRLQGFGDVAIVLGLGIVAATTLLTL